ncbi:MAG: DUF924 domain-containing protein [Bdellovibrionaceae bacterium]|nr:DUF924 domain-containing protein [Bdellovibrionales bacterium]MCB9085175.1 DUF924 domain-containing protein [Pseudobdellovibrionaceae bacterium]
MGEEFDLNLVLSFWFEELSPKQWWTKDPKLDDLIKNRFLQVHRAAAQKSLMGWRRSPVGRLAEVIVLDQFSRNMFRDTPEAFAYDILALECAKQAVEAKEDHLLPVGRRYFLYMPYMHSEDPKAHEEAVKLFSQPGLEGGLDYELKHKAIIDRFGRYPHRNQILGRESTPEEVDFLKGPNSSF